VLLSAALVRRPSTAGGMERKFFMMTRRHALKTTALASLAFAASWPSRIASAQTAPSGPYTVPPLPYPFDALEPHIDAQTMQIHHDKHHAAYVANLNKAVAQFPDLGNKPVEDLLKDLNAVPEQIRTAVRNQGGGHYNHSLFWQMMNKNAGGEPSGELAQAIDKKFGSFAAFKEQFTKAAVGQFGSGWAWLVADGDELKIQPSSNQDSPVSDGKKPLLGIDVWEHAYYLKYQNRRPEYVAAWFNVINWDFASQRFLGKGV
jgi:Fe-Mn family superoxide dismutase